MQKVTVDGAKTRLEKLMRTAQDAPIYLLPNGQHAAVLVSAEAWETLHTNLEDAEDALTTLQHQLDPEHTVSLKDVARGGIWQ